MKVAIFFALAAVFVAAEACKDGERFMAPDGCNKCVCIKGKAACTKMWCPPRKSLRCKNGETFIASDGCNKCKCIGGKAACTKMRCPPKKVKRDAEECEPDTVWKKDCNVCLCTDEGTAVCTTMECF
uniref:Venom pacifastin 2 n=1 Tax=Oncocephalus sp. TaxID=2944721 RepID=A0AB38ZEQ6_9HEMI